jgi:hypothetical protein
MKKMILKRNKNKTVKYKEIKKNVKLGNTINFF